MGKTKNAVRVGAAAFALGLSLAGPQAIGVASADSPDPDSASASAAPDPTPARGTAPRRSATERAARVPRSAATAPPVARAALPAVAVEQQNSSPARAAASIARSAALPANPTGRRARQVSPVVTEVSDSAAIPTPASTVAPVAAPAVALTNSDSVASLPAPPAMAAAGTDLLTQVNAAVTNWFDSSANWLATGLAGGPASDLLQGALLLVRRNLFNQIPTIDPVQIQTTFSGQILGVLGAVDPEGDPLTYTLTEAPKLGSVQFSPDGTYTYTPGTDFTEGDSFTVAVNDGGFNILDPLGNWRPAQATVSVRALDREEPPEGVVTKALIYRTFEVTNLTSTPQKLAAWSATRKVVEVAPVGTILLPGATTEVLLAQYAFQDNVAVAEFRPVDSNGNAVVAPSGGGFTVRLATRPFGSTTSCTAGNCASYDDDYIFGSRDRVAILLDPPGTVISLPSGEGQKQADALNRLCGGSGGAKCRFVAKNWTSKAYAPWEYAEGAAVENDTTSNLTTTLMAKTTETFSTGLKLTVSAKTTLFKIVEASVSAEFNKTWTKSYEFSQSISPTVKPGERVFVVVRSPIQTATGDFTVVLGNTTFNLYDVTFDTPDSKRQLDYRAITVPISQGSYLPTD